MFSYLYSCVCVLIYCIYPCQRKTNPEFIAGQYIVGINQNGAKEYIIFHIYILESLDGGLARVEVLNIYQKHQNLSKTCLSRLFRLNTDSSQGHGMGGWAWAWVGKGS